LQRALSREEDAGRPTGPGLVLLKVKFAECPIQATLGILGKKWTMLILRDVGLRKIRRFNRLLESIPGLTPRVLSMRLSELEEEGYIKRLESQRTPRVVRWALTEKGHDTIPILLRFVEFGAKWHADVAFEDKRPRKLHELFKPEALSVLRKYAEAPISR
jgi:DNA-binding HxlR family transcriptional regulator